LEAKLAVASAIGIALQKPFRQEVRLRSGVLSHLQRTVDHRNGLQFIAFIPDSHLETAFPGAWPQTANLRNIEALIRLHGLDFLEHTAERQVEIWRRSVAPIANFFNKLKNPELPEADGASSSLTRIVLDVETGGLFYAPVGSHGWVFGATLDQQPMNSGQAEKHFVAAVKHLHGELNGMFGSEAQGGGL
jgi:hypothetical protein